MCALIVTSTCDDLVKQEFHSHFWNTILFHSLPLIQHKRTAINKSPIALVYLCYFLQKQHPSGSHWQTILFLIIDNCSVTSTEVVLVLASNDKSRRLMISTNDTHHSSCVMLQLLTVCIRLHDRAPSKSSFQQKECSFSDNHRAVIFLWFVIAAQMIEKVDILLGITCLHMNIQHSIITFNNINITEVKPFPLMSESRDCKRNFNNAETSLRFVICT